MKRSLFTVLSIACLLLGVGMATLWVRSYWAHDHYSVIRVSGSADQQDWVRLAVRSNSGLIELYHQWKNATPRLNIKYGRENLGKGWVVESHVSTAAWDGDSRRPGLFLGFGAFTERDTVVSDAAGAPVINGILLAVVIPYWAVVAALAIIPVWRWRRAREAGKRQQPPDPITQ